MMSAQGRGATAAEVVEGIRHFLIENDLPDVLMHCVEIPVESIGRLLTVLGAPTGGLFIKDATKRPLWGPVEAPPDDSCDDSIWTKRLRLDPGHVQVLGSCDVIERRIGAFVARKRSELNRSNVLEFCAPRQGAETSARTCATLINRTMQVRPYSVDNKADMALAASCTQRHTPKDGDVGSSQLNFAEGVEERLRNLEQVLIVPGEPVRSLPRDIYTRIRSLEARVLQLEDIGWRLTDRWWHKFADDTTTTKKATTEGDTEESELPLSAPPLPSSSSASPAATREDPQAGYVPVLNAVEGGEDYDHRIRELEASLLQRNT